MNKDEIRENVSVLRKYLGAISGGPMMHVLPEDIEILKKVYAEIAKSTGMNGRLNTSCSDCIKYAIVNCIDYCNREC